MLRRLILSFRRRSCCSDAIPAAAAARRILDPHHIPLQTARLCPKGGMGESVPPPAVLAFLFIMRRGWREAVMCPGFILVSHNTIIQ